MGVDTFGDHKYEGKIVSVLLQGLIDSELALTFEPNHLMLN